MPSITEGRLTFVFPNGWKATQYDDWTFFQSQFQKIATGTKAVDLLAFLPGNNRTLWIIEVKDYRMNPRTKVIDLAEEVAVKVRDSLAGIFAAATQANDAGERTFATQAVRSSRFRIVLHLEQPATHSKLFPRPFDPAKVRQRLKQLVKAIDPHPLVIEIAQPGHIPWKVSSS